MRTPSQRQLALLTKFLGLTGSSQDGEALTAMRMAQKVLKELDATWEDVIAGRLSSVSVGAVHVTRHQPSYSTPRKPTYAPPPNPSRPRQEYRPDNAPRYTFSATHERYTDSDINLIFEPMHGYPFRFEDKASLDALWRTFLKDRRLNTGEFAELMRLHKICASGVNRTGRA